jgi:hypothetical protein
MIALNNKLRFISLFFMLPSLAFSQAILLGEVRGNKIYKDPVLRSIKIGNAYSTWVHVDFGDYITSNKVLIDCRGSWISEPYDYNFAFEEEEKTNVLKFSVDETIDYNNHSNLMPFSKSDLIYKNIIRSRVGEFCSKAAEKRGHFFPISASYRDPKGHYEVYNLVSSSYRKVNNINTVWLKVIPKIKTEMKGQNGEILRRDDGEPLMRSSTLNNSYQMQRVGFECKEGKYGAFQIIEYDVNGKPNTTLDQAPNINRLSDTVPGTVGEGIVEALCKIF